MNEKIKIVSVEIVPGHELQDYWRHEMQKIEIEGKSGFFIDKAYSRSTDWSKFIGEYISNIYFTESAGYTWLQKNKKYPIKVHSEEKKQNTESETLKSDNNITIKKVVVVKGSSLNSYWGDKMQTIYVDGINNDIGYYIDVLPADGGTDWSQYIGKTLDNYSIRQSTGYDWLQKSKPGIKVGAKRTISQKTDVKKDTKKPIEKEAVVKLSLWQRLIKLFRG